MNTTFSVHENVFQQMSICFSNKDVCIRFWFQETGDDVTRVPNSIDLVMELETWAQRKAKQSA
jgi:hypothetical protein